MGKSLLLLPPGLALTEGSGPSRDVRHRGPDWGRGGTEMQPRNGSQGAKGCLRQDKDGRGRRTVTVFQAAGAQWDGTSY